MRFNLSDNPTFRSRDSLRVECRAMMRRLLIVVDIKARLHELLFKLIDINWVLLLGCTGTW